MASKAYHVWDVVTGKAFLKDERRSRCSATLLAPSLVVLDHPPSDLSAPAQAGLHLAPARKPMRAARGWPKASSRWLSPVPRPARSRCAPGAQSERPETLRARKCAGWPRLAVGSSKKGRRERTRLAPHPPTSSPSLPARCTLASIPPRRMCAVPKMSTRFLARLTAV